MIELVREIHGKMLAFAPQYVGDPAKCVFRIYRDTRFAKDKTPYKTHIAAYFPRNGFEKRGGGFYLAISPAEIHLGGGMYSPEPDVLLGVRRLIESDYEAFRKTFDSAKIRKLAGEPRGESVTRPPKGFDPEHPAIEFIKRKQIYFMATLETALATTPKLLPEAVKRFEAMTPLIEFLNRPLVNNAKQRF